MNAQELESRIVEAEKDASKVRKLIADFKADKDSQLSDLTGQVNLANAATAKLQAEIDAHKDKTLETAKEILAAIKDPSTNTDEAVAALIIESTKDERQKQIDALDAKIVAAQRERAELVAK